ncbi:MAG TPA: hypothetical protein VN841_05250 [Bryobacteraceae bacterium]|nr:hypothetical protein [Bryobacteraceae bacterium]
MLPGEDKEEFERHRASYIKRFQPRDQPEQDLVETLVAARWRLNRLMSIEAQLLENAEEPKDILKALSLLTRYENQLNRTFDKALQHLQALQENRPTAKNSAVRNEPKPTSKSDQDLLLQIEKAMRAPVPTPNITQKHPNAAV